MPRSEFLAMHPGVFFLDPDRPGELESFLREATGLSNNERVVKVGKAGDGNMNCTVRVETSAGRSVIIKQARPWVEKYPQFTAPWDRALREMEFYQLAGGAGSDHELAAALPEVLRADAANRLLILEDLGRGGDCSDIYGSARFSQAEIIALARFLSGLHRGFLGSEAARQLDNRAMRELNHAHIFDIPLAEDNGLDLDAIVPGLGDAAESTRGDAALVSQIHALGEEVYLADGATLGDAVCLVHGDFFPGSFLRTKDGLRIIDPEFCFGGHAEFDSGVFLAHLVLGRQPAGMAQCFLNAYMPPPGHCERVMLRLAGVEIIRRLIGYAQLPLAATLEERVAMLGKARALVLEPDCALVLD